MKSNVSLIYLISNESYCKPFFICDEIILRFNKDNWFAVTNFCNQKVNYPENEIP